MKSNQEPKRISRETFAHLNSLEQIIGQRFLLEGRWILTDEGEK